MPWLAWAAASSLSALVLAAWAFEVDLPGLEVTVLATILALASIALALLAVLALFHMRRSTRLYTEQLELAEALREAEARLRLAADEENRRKDEFLATLGHELRNPLAPIRAAAQILTQQGQMDPDLARIAGILERQVQHMARLIEDLLDVSRVSMGRVTLRRKVVSLPEIVEEALEASAANLEGSGHELRVTLPEEEILVDADPTRLAQVVLSLLDNAAKFTPRGGRIEVVAEARGDEAVVVVRDTGIGIQADELPEIFGMFKQVGPSRGSGLGVGLALAGALMELHGGRIEAASAGLGEGAEFRVALARLAPAVEGAGGSGAPAEPDEEAAPPAEAAPQEAPSAGMSCAQSPAPLRVLLVDDNSDALETLAAILRMSGLEVRCAADGPAALLAAEEFSPHAVGLDIGLPGMSGYEVAERLRARSPEPRPLLIALTGWGQAEDRRRGEEAGFDHHFTKPIDVQVLLGLLRAAAERGAQSPGAGLEAPASK